MLASHSGRCIVLAAALCVLAIFFFPLAHGSFQTTHGPTTDFRAKQAFLVLMFSIFIAVARLVAIVMPWVLRPGTTICIQASDLCLTNNPGRTVILRC
jgi:hypothetical protein